MAYIDASAVEALRSARELDVVITHQGPARFQGPSSGAEILDPLLDRSGSLIWFHGHSRARREPAMVGSTWIVPLGDATFERHDGWRIRPDAWYRVVRTGGGVATSDRRPAALAELARHAWIERDGCLVAPHLAAFAP
jgi:hypothetical protein